MQFVFSTEPLTSYRNVVQCIAMSNTASAAPGRENDETIAVRLPAHLRDKIDAKRARMAEAIPGAGVTRSDAVRALILVGLAAEDE